MRSGGGESPRGASTKYWVITAVITWLLLMLPPPIDLLGLGWLVYRVRKYLNDKKKEASKVTSRLNTRYANIMLRNNKAIVNAEITGEDERFIRVVDGMGKEMLINKNDISILEPITQEMD